MIIFLSLLFAGVVVGVVNGILDIGRSNGKKR